MLPYDAIAPSGAGAPVQRSMLRMRAVAAVVAIAMVACVALLGAGSLPVGRSELVILGDKHVGLNRLVFKVLSKGDKMSVGQLAEMVQTWVPTGPPRGLSPQAMELLAENRGKGKALTELLSDTMLDEGEGQLCKKKDIIIDKFDQLLRKLGGEELSLNISLGRMGAEWHAAMAGWLDSESTYRLRIEQAKEAKTGSAFAEQEYEKYRQACKEAKENYEAGMKKHEIERKDMDDERELIKMILRYIGVLHDVKATEKSIAAGGRDSVKDSETGVSDINGSYKATTTAELKAKIAQLTELIQTTKTPGAFQKLALLHSKTSKLAVYAETVEVANILKEMLEDIKTRREVIDKVDEGAKKLMDDVNAKMVEWEGKLVALGNAMDKAKALQDAAKLEREKLNGDNHVIEIAATEQNKAARVMIPPYEREIYVITMIKKKILEKCAAPAAE
jgi:hypothetical protein